MVTWAKLAAALRYQESRTKVDQLVLVMLRGKRERERRQRVLDNWAMGN